VSVISSITLIYPKDIVNSVMLLVMSALELETLTVLAALLETSFS